MLRRAPFAAFALALVLAAPAARATDAAAAEAFKAGAASYQKGDFRTAAASFERAYRESPRGAAVYNAGLAWEAASEAPRAADAYATALDAGDLGAQQKKDAQARLANLAKTLGRIDVSGPAGAKISVEHCESAALPTKVFLTAGAHELTARFDGGASTSKQQVTVAAGATTAVTIEPPKAAAPPPPPPPQKVESPTPALAPAASNPRKLVGFVALGGALVASGAAVYFGVSAVSAKDDFNSSGHRDQNAHDRADELRTITNVTWVAAGVLAATGVVLVLTAPKAPNDRAVTATVGPTGGALTVRF